jgi:hypothetical protein
MILKGGRWIVKWTEVRSSYPSQWVIIEAVEATTRDKKRIINEMIVISSFDDNNMALRKYIDLHKEHPDREIYVVHTSRETLDIEELTWTGVRKK